MRIAHALLVAMAGCGFHSGGPSATDAPPAQGDWLAVSANGNTTCAIALDQSLWCWGDNANGQVGVGASDAEIAVPARVGSATWTAVSTGGFHVCGLQSDGSLWCWGRNVEGQLGVDETTGVVTTETAPAPVATAVAFAQVSAGYVHTCAIATDRTMYCWGDNYYGAYGDGTTMASRVPLQTAVTSWSSIAAAFYATCALRSDQTLWCAGLNNNGELGNGTSAATGNVSEPFATQVPGSWQQLAMTYLHACAIQTDGRVRCWGYNGEGQLGNGTTTDSWSPEAVGADHDDWTAIATGVEQTCGTRAGGQLWCWGGDQFGQIAVSEAGALENAEPMQVAAVPTAAAISLGANHSCAIDGNHVLTCTGLAALGQLGDGTTSRRAPVQIPGTWDRVSAGAATTCARALDGSLSCWGDNTYGQLADDRATPSQAPIASVAPGPQQLALGAVHACELLATGEVWCWGDPSLGKTGDPDHARSTPGMVPAVDATAVSSRDHTCAIPAAPARGLVCWGNNLYGQLGDGNATTVYTTVSVFAGTGFAIVAAGGQFSPRGLGFTCGISTVGVLYCWGDNHFGQIGDGATATTPVFGASPIAGTWSNVALGAYHGCAIAQAGTLACWGYNSNGQLGDGTLTSQSSPEPIGSATWAQLALGTLHSCGIQSNGSLWCWGANLRGEVGNGTSTDVSAPAQIGTDTTWMAITAGDQHTCAIKADHSLWCWGSNSNGQIGDATAWRAAWAAIPKVRP
ncbi:MAG TPA: hypothetical protein VGF94_00580 [Kofleriaceae bacterium]